MSNSGFYLMARGWMQNPAFKREKFTEREAWLWIIEKAAWAPHVQYNGNALPVQVERGEFIASIEAMADAWGWGTQKVQVFLRRLEITNMVSRKITMRISVIKVSNYEAYQSGVKFKSPDESPDAISGNHQMNHQMPIIKTNSKTKEIPPTPKGEAELPLLGGEMQSMAATPLERFPEFYTLWPRKEKPDTAKRAWAKAVEERTVEQILDAAHRFIREGFEADPRPKAEKVRFVPYPASWLNSGGFKAYEGLAKAFDGPEWENPALSDFERQKLWGRANGMGPDYTPADWN